MDEFRVAMSHGDVRAYAQPVVDLASGRVVGYRGLARWHHRRLGTLNAAAFIQMIADTPLANQVDLYIARETAAVLALTTRDTSLCLYVPVSKRLIADVRTEQYLSEIAGAFSLGTNQMRLQLAPAALGNWNPALRDALHSLRDADVAFVLTGVESASDVRHAAEYGFREVHLSRRLTHAAATDADARLAVSGIVQLAHDQLVLVAATGVDHQQHRDVLIEMSCDLATGDLYGEPEPTTTID
jgi:EAL domain-containing protein (putative c-di-GMP-specific phosphodiesterase class I)